MLDFPGLITPFEGTLEFVAVLGFSVELMDVYNIGIHRYQCQSIDIDCILLHVKSEGELPISVLRN
jgi:hypothetical protein